MKTSLVTGGAGFIGSHLAASLLDMGHRVIVLDDLSGGFRDNIPAGAEFIQGSVTDYPLVQKLFASEPIDYVYHLAAYAAEGLSHFIKRFNYENKPDRQCKPTSMNLSGIKSNALFLLLPLQCTVPTNYR